MPVLLGFDTVIVPEFEMVPPELIAMSTPVYCEFDKTRSTPLGMVRTSPNEIVIPLVIVHDESTPFHVPPNVEAQVFTSTVPPPTAYTFCVETRRISTAIERMISSFG